MLTVSRSLKNWSLRRKHISSYTKWKDIGQHHTLVDCIHSIYLLVTIFIRAVFELYGDSKLINLEWNRCLYTSLVHFWMSRSLVLTYGSMRMLFAFASPHIRFDSHSHSSSHAVTDSVHIWTAKLLFFKTETKCKESKMGTPKSTDSVVYKIEKCC